MEKTFSNTTDDGRKLVKILSLSMTEMEMVSGSGERQLMFKTRDSKTFKGKLTRNKKAIVA